MDTKTCSLRIFTSCQLVFQCELKEKVDRHAIFMLT